MNRHPRSMPYVAVLIAAGFLLIATGFFVTPRALAETWSDNTGKFQIEAEFVELKGMSVMLHKADGSTITVPLNRLSAESRALAEKLDQAVATEHPSDSTQPSAVAPIPGQKPISSGAEPTLKTPVAPSVAPMPAFPDDASLQATFEFCRNQFLAGHPEVLWHALPRDIRDMFDRQDLRNDIVAPLKVQEPIIKGSQDLLKKVVTILGKQKKFMLESEMLTAMAPPETMPMIQQGYDPAVGLSYELGMLLLSMNTLESKTVTELLNERGPRLGGHLKAILSLVPPEMIEATLSRTEIEQHDEETGVMRLQSEDGTTQTIEMVRYLDRWVPKDLVDSWLANKEGIEEEIKSNLKSLPETASAKQTIAMITEGITFLNQSFDPLSASKTQKEFDQAVNDFAMLVGTPSDWLMMAFTSGAARVAVQTSGDAGNADMFARLGDDDTNPKMTAVPLNEFNSLWKLTSIGGSKPAGQLLSELSGPLGLNFDPPEAFSESLSQPVTLASDVQSRLAAIEQVCRDIQCKPIYRASHLEIERGIRKIPATPVGPFLALPSSFNTDPDSATGQLSVDLVSAGLSPAMTHQISETLEFKLDSAISNDDTPLFWKSISQREAMFEEIASSSEEGLFVLDQSKMGKPQEDAAAHQIFSQRALRLKGLLRNVKEVKAINGTVSINLTTQVVALKFDDLTGGMEQTDGETKARITEATERRFTIEVEWPEEEPNQQVNNNGFRRSKDIEVFALDADGKSVAIISRGSFGSGNSKTLSLSLEAIPASLELIISLGTEALTYPVTLRNISVPNHEQMPDKLMELSFEGDQPVKLEFKRVSGSGNFRDIEVTVTNKSNKTVTNLTVLSKFLDAEGKTPPLKKTRFGSEESSSTTNAICTLSPGMTREIELAAFDMPEATESASLELKHVGFSDATLWDAGQE